jgi:S-adenosylmethionine synthetase
MILLTGSSGFLGKILYRVFSGCTETTGLCYTNQVYSQLIKSDVSDRKSLLNILNTVNPSCIVHSAAWRDPERCENDPDGARAIHVDATAVMAEWCTMHDACLVYISTDYIFDGTSPPYGESDGASPVNVYGRTKAVGECAARQTNKHIVVRVPLQYGFSQVPDDSFVIKVLEKMSSADTVALDNVQLRHPTLSDDVAQAILNLLHIDFTGTIHLRGTTDVTRFAIWQIIADVFDCDPSCVLALPEAAVFAAARPNDSRLSTDLYSSLDLPPFHSFRDGLAIVRKQMMEYGFDWHRA